MKPLTEQYRPACWEDVIAQDDIVNRIRLLQSRGMGGRALFFMGASGTGKTTCARLIAQDNADPCNVTELNARDIDIGWCQDFEDAQQYRPLASAEKPCRVWILNEAHLMRPAIVSRLLTTLEALAPFTIVIFTTTSENAEKWEDSTIDTAPFLSRCAKLPLARRDLEKPFAERCKAIAEREGLAPAGVPIERYVKLMQNHRNNIRSALNAIESGEFA